MRGGKRNGAGRKPGSPTEKRRPIAKIAEARGMTPYDVMEEAMWAEYDAGNLREAAAIAKDCAPYKHPRLSSSQIKAEVEMEASQVVEFIVTSREQADAAIAALANASGVPRQ